MGKAFAPALVARRFVETLDAGTECNGAETLDATRPTVAAALGDPALCAWE
jgi:hypothetical protein